MMAKTVPPGTITIPTGQQFEAGALPDPFDSRDFPYRPRLQPLPPVLDQRVGSQKPYVMTQQGNSCTGHAVAATVNAALARGSADAGNDQAAERQRMSPYMLYALARRYDEFPGERDVGSSLRGALKGWFNHGVLPEADWADLDQDPAPDLDDDGVALKAAQCPLGAFYRVDPFRLDDMQSAITELNAICVSGVVHDGWRKPKELSLGDKTMHVICRDVAAQAIGAHAYVLVGYNDIGFLVQNSWGPRWGKGGFATLPYEDWLQSAYDAWVCRNGVPNTPLAGGWSRNVEGSAGRLMTGAGPDLRRLAAHVVNLGNDGRLSSSGRFTSTPQQIDRAFEHMGRWHDFWQQRDAHAPRRIVLFAHGGLNSEEQALQVAQANLNWWLNNRVYPLFFAWQSGVGETLLDQLRNQAGRRFPAGFGFDRTEAIDRLVEGLARVSSRRLWEEMKENAEAASDRPENVGDVRGGTLVVDRLKTYLDAHGAANVEVHLVGHSAGAIFHAKLLEPLRQAGVPVASLAFLAPALRVSTFESEVLPHLGHRVARFATFNLSDRRELDDTCSGVYNKSLLYLVSRALERGSDREVPLLGMERFLARPVTGGQRSLREAIEAGGGTIVTSPSSPRAAADSRSNSTSHGGFDDDPATMTSVLLRILGTTAVAPGNGYQRNAPLRETGPLPAAARLAAAQPVRPEATAAAQPTVAAEVHPPDESPLVETAERQEGHPAVPDQPGQVRLEVADAPRSGSPILDHLLAAGWQPTEPT
jgi:hypothetical protein